MRLTEMNQIIRLVWGQSPKPLEDMRFAQEILGLLEGLRIGVVEKPTTPTSGSICAEGERCCECRRFLDVSPEPVRVGDRWFCRWCQEAKVREALLGATKHKHEEM